VNVVAPVSLCGTRSRRPGAQAELRVNRFDCARRARDCGLVNQIVTFLGAGPPHATRIAQRAAGLSTGCATGTPRSQFRSIGESRPDQDRPLAHRFKPYELDSETEQLAALTCGELFLVWCERVTNTTKPNSVSSNRRHYSGCDEGQLLEPTVGSEVTEFKSSRHFRSSVPFHDFCANGC
jgi:hypothetical protein